MVTMLADLATPPDHVMLDTNVLLAATDEGREIHSGALRLISSWPDAGVTLYLSGQVVREYVAVATRPVAANGLGLDTADAVRNVAAFRERTTLLTENGKVTDRLLALVRDTDCGGKQVHDANLVATMLAHRVDTVVTANTRDFVRFGDYITLIGLSRACPIATAPASRDRALQRVRRQPSPSPW